MVNRIARFFGTHKQTFCYFYRRINQFQSNFSYDLQSLGQRNGHTLIIEKLSIKIILCNTSMKTGCEASKVHPQQRVYIQVSKKVVTNSSITIIKHIPAVTLLLVKMMLQYTRGKIWRMMGRRSSGCLLLIVKQLLFSTKIICNS